MNVPVYGLDIETDTSGGYGLDPAKGGIVSIAVVGPDGDYVLDIDEFAGNERRLLVGFNHLLGFLPAGVMATWNGSGFDGPFLAERCERHGIETGIELVYDPTLPIKYDPLPGHPGAYRVAFDAHGHIDVAYAYRRFAAEAGVSWSLKPVAKAAGLEVIEVDRTRIHELTSDEREAYVASDARLARQLALMAADRLSPDRLAFVSVG